MKHITLLSLTSLTVILALPTRAFDYTNRIKDVVVVHQYRFSEEQITDILKAEIKRQNPSAVTDTDYYILHIPQRTTDEPILLNIFQVITPPPGTQVVVFKSYTNSLWDVPCSCTVYCSTNTVVK